MGCRSSSVVNPVPSSLVDLQTDEVKFEILIALKRDDPVLLEQIMKSKSVSYQEKINERVDMNWTILHIAAAKNAYKATEYLLTAYLAFTDPAFDLVNARDFSGKTPLMLASDYSSFKTFESILQLCTRFNHPVIMDQKYEKSFDKSSPYFVLLQDYKFGNMNPSRDASGSTNLTKEDEKHCLVLNKGSLDTYYKTKEKITKSEKGYKDKDFGHSSSGVPASTNLNDDAGSEKSVKWVSLSKIYGDNYNLFDQNALKFDETACENSVNMNLLYVFRAISMFPNHLNNIFLETQTLKSGFFPTILYRDFIPSITIVDDYFPCGKKKDEVMFQKAFGSEVWPMVIEKALAKMLNHYSYVATLSIEDLFEIILGAPTMRMSVKKYSTDIFWLKLHELEVSHSIMLGSLLENKNIYLSIEGTYEYENKRIVKLVSANKNAKLRKTLSETLIEDEMKKIIGYETKEAGIFYMDFEDFCEEFDEIVVSVFNSGWMRSNLIFKKPGTHAETFEFELKRPSTVYLSFIQIESDKQNYCPLHFVLLSKSKKGTYQSVAEGDSNALFGAKISYVTENLKLDLEPGKYITQVKLPEKGKSLKEGILMAYSSELISFNPVSSKKNLNEILISLGESHDMKESCSNNCLYAAGHWSIYNWFYFENNSDKKWETEIKFENLVNLKLGKEFKSAADTFNVVTQKGQKEVVYLEKKDPALPTDFKIHLEHNFS